MIVDILHQRAGIDSSGEELKNIFLSGRYNSFRVLAAYISWNGLNLIHKEIEQFYDKGNKISIIIGLGGEDNSVSDVLRYFVQRFPKGEFFVFHVPVTHYLFHPKVYIFSKGNETLVMIGSNNFTQGGLFCNSECYVKILINHKKDKKLRNEIEKLWNSYKHGKYPFSNKNLKRIDKNIIGIFNKIRDKKPKKRKLTVKEKYLRKFFPLVRIPLPAQINYIKKENIKRLSGEKRRKTKNLLLEILKETGPDRTQVQVPVKVIKEFFKTKTTQHQTIQIKFKNNIVRPAVICHFPNNTHRISFPELSKFKRPLIVKFINAGDKLFLLKPLTGKEYKKSIRKCVNQTRKMAKRWGYV